MIVARTERVLLFGEATWKEIEALDRPRTTAILPVGAVEAHGPHLPLTTDGRIAAAMAIEGARRLAGTGQEVVVLPGIDYSAAPFARDFPGTVSVRPETLAALVIDVAAALSEQGFGLLAIANAHFDPTHLAALQFAVREISERGLLPVAYPDVTRRRWASRLGEEFLSGACHAGRYEGSIVLAAHPDGVREPIQRSLPANPISLSGAIRDGRSSFREAGGSEAYFGDPAAASTAEGVRTIEVLGQILLEEVQARWETLRSESAE